MTNCPRCGLRTVIESGNKVYCSNPPQWDERERCFGCGYISEWKRVYGKTTEQSLEDEWREKNLPHPFKSG